MACGGESIIGVRETPKEKKTEKSGVYSVSAMAPTILDNSHGIWQLEYAADVPRKLTMVRPLAWRRGAADSGPGY